MKTKEFLKKKGIEISLKRYGIDALGAMAQGLFCSLLIGTIINTFGSQLHIGFLTEKIATVGGTDYTVGGIASAMSGPAMAVAIGYALQCPPLVLFSMTAVGFAANALGGAGGPLAVLFVAIIAAEFGKAVSKETKIDILVTPLVTIGIGMFLSWLIAPPLGKAAMAVGNVIMWATELQPFLMGILVSVIVGVALTLPISSAAICAALLLTGLCGCSRNSSLIFYTAVAAPAQGFDPQVAADETVMTKVTAMPIPRAVEGLFETPRNGQIPRNLLKMKFSVRMAANMIRKMLPISQCLLPLPPERRGRTDPPLPQREPVLQTPRQ